LITAVTFCECLVIVSEKDEGGEGYAK